MTRRSALLLGIILFLSLALADLRDFNFSAFKTQDTVYVQVDNLGDRNNTLDYVLFAQFSLNQTYTDYGTLELGPGESDLVLVPRLGELEDLTLEADNGYGVYVTVFEANESTLLVHDISVDAGFDSENRCLAVTLENKGDYDEDVILEISNQETYEDEIQVPKGESETRCYSLDPGEYQIKARIDYDYDESDNKVTAVVPGSGLWVSRVYMNRSYVYADIYNDLGETEVYVELVEVYSGETRTYGTNVTLEPGNNTVYAPLEDGYLVYVEARVDPDNLVTPSDPNKTRVLDVKEFIDVTPPEITIKDYCQNATAGIPCNVSFEISDRDLEGYSISWGTGDLETERFYAHSPDEIVERQLIFSEPGSGVIKISAWDSYGNENIAQINISVSQNFEMANEIIGIAHYPEVLDIWRDYFYNPDSDRTLIRTRITALASGKYRINDWIPLPVSQGKLVLVSPSHSGSDTRPVFNFSLEKGSEVELYYLISGRADPRLVSDMPAPNITVISGETQNLTEEKSTRIFHLGNYTITRTWRYLPDENLTIIVTNITGLDPERVYSITDQYLDEFKGHDLFIFPEPDNKTKENITWIVENQTGFIYAYRLYVYIPPEVLDKLGTPRIVEKRNETNKEPVPLPPKKVTGLLAMVEEGALTYAGLVILSALVALYMISRETPEVEETVTEEDLILGELAKDMGLA